MDNIYDFFEILDNEIKKDGGTLNGFIAQTGDGKTLFMILLTEYFLRGGKNVHFFSIYGNSKKNITDKISERISLDQIYSKCDISNIGNLSELKKALVGKNKNDIIILDGLDIMMMKNRKNGDNISFLRDYKIFYTSNTNTNTNTNNGNISMGNKFQKINNLVMMSNNIFYIELEKTNLNFKLETIKSRTSNFTGMITHSLRFFYRKRKIQNLLQYL